MGLRHAGVSMIEALVALAVLAVGTVGLLHWQGAMAAASEASREQVQAVQWLRSVLEADRGRADRLAAGLHGAMPGASPRPALQQTAMGDGVLATVVSTARWTDRMGANQAWSFATQRRAPDLMTADFFEPGWAPTGFAPRGVGGRAADVPRDAIDVGAANSFVPSSGGGLAGWLLDRHRGEIVGACATEAVPAATDANPRGLLPDGCEPLAARLIAGVVRFALGLAPRAEGPYDDPLPLQVEWQDATGRLVTPACDLQSRRGSDPHLAWRCAVPSPAVVGVENPEPTLRPAGWTLHGPQPTHRLCRYLDAVPALQRASAVSPDIALDPWARTGAEAAGGDGLVPTGLAPTGPRLHRWLVIASQQACPDGTSALAVSDGLALAPGQSGG
jgi:Tfp pilus assembly protein PilV